MKRTIRSVLDLIKRFPSQPKFIPNTKEIFSINDNKIALKKILSGPSSPIYVYSGKIFLNRLHQAQSELKKHWGGNHQIAFSFKTNYSFAISPLIKKNSILAEVVSAREYEMAQKSGIRGENIIYNGPHKDLSSLKQAISQKSLINFDHLSEIDQVIKIASDQHTIAKVGIRLKADIKHVGQSRFGFNLENHEATQAIQKILSSSRLQLDTLHIHIGTDIDNPASYFDASTKLAVFINEQYHKFGFLPKTIDFGGGFPANGHKPYWKKTWFPKTISEYIKSIAAPLKQNYPVSQFPTLIIEPGRFLVDDAGIFINRILDVKNENGQQKITSDGSVLFLPVKYYRPQIVKIFTPHLKQRQEKYISTIIFGATCKEDDQLHSEVLPSSLPNDYLIFFITGAYNENMAPEFIFQKPISIIL